MPAPPTLPQALALLALEPDSGALRPAHALPRALVAAAVAELALAGRLDLDADRLVRVKDARPTGDPALDPVLERLAASPEPRPLDRWAASLGGSANLVRDRTLAGLVERGLVRREERRTLGLFSSVRHPAANPGPARELRERVRAAVMGGAVPDERLRLLLGLVHAAGLVDAVFEREERREAALRLRELADGRVDGARAATTGDGGAELAMLVVLMTATSGGEAGWADADGGGDGGDGGGGGGE